MIGLESEEHDECLFKQIYSVSVFYAISILTDYINHLLSEQVLENNDIICAQNHYLIVHSEKGGVYMLYYTFTVILYSLVMLYVFYRLPMKYNMVAYDRYGIKKIKVHGAMQAS